METVLQRAAVILRSFSTEEPVLTLAEIVRRTGMPKTTAHRLLHELAELGFLDPATPGYRLGSAMFEMGLRASSKLDLLELATPFLQDLYERTHETVHLGVREGHEVHYVAKITGHHSVRTPTRTGAAMPLHCTSIGKMLLAHADPKTRLEVLAGPLERRTARTIIAPGILQRQLDAALTDGYATEFEESGPGVQCVAAPVFDGEEVVAAISITAAVGRFRLKPHIPAVRAAARGLGGLVGRYSEGSASSAG